MLAESLCATYITLDWKEVGDVLICEIKAKAREDRGKSRGRRNTWVPLTPKAAVCQCLVRGSCSSRSSVDLPSAGKGEWFSVGTSETVLFNRDLQGVGLGGAVGIH